MTDYIIGIDAGTTGIRTFCFAKNGKIISSAYSEFKQIFPKPGWVEHDPEEIWEKTQWLIREAIRLGNLDPKKANAIGITNQRETTVLFTRKGKPVYNAIVWQCRRTASMCDDLKKRNLEDTFRNKTGLVIDAYFSGTKINWILQNVSKATRELEKDNLLFGTIDTWLLYKLSNGKSHRTDFTNASRTLIFNIQEKQWDTELLGILDIPRNLLPEVQSSSSLFGKTEKVEGLPDGIPITSMVGDQQGALFGQLCTEPGSAKNTYGTGCFLLYNTGQNFILSKNGLVTTLACDKNGEPVYALEGSVFIAGAAIQYLRDNFGFFKKSSETELLARSVTKEDEIVFVPAFSGLGAPYWNMDVRGMIVGLTRDTTKEQIIRAALKSIALQSMDLVNAMEADTGTRMKELRVDGGVTANQYLMQYQADILGAKVKRPVNVDTTVLGASYLAGLYTGFFQSTAELKKMEKIDHEFKPTMKQKERDREINKWRKAIKMIQS